jgi:hypothetical protein
VSTWRGVAVAVAVVAAAAFAIWSTSSRAPRAPSNPPNAPPRDAANDPVAATAPARQPLAPEPARLRLSVVDPEEHPLAGRITVLFDRDVPSHAPPLEGNTPIRDVARIDHDGAAMLDVPPGSWTWLRATASDPAGGAAYRLVAPFAGERHETVVLLRDRARVHVFVVEGDLETPCAHRTFEVLRDAESKPSEHATPTTDAAGHALVDDLPPGRVLLVAPGASPTDPPPHALWIQATLGHDRVVTLVAREPSRRIVLDVRAELPADGAAPVLVLARHDDGSGRHFPLRNGILPGRHEHALDLPHGVYRVLMLPVGGFLTASDDELVRVAPDSPSTHLVRLAPNPNAARVRLRGIDERALPMTVYPRPVGQVVDDVPRVMFFGPWRWRSAEQQVGCPPFRCRLIACRANRYWLSTDECELGPGQHEVAMLPAALLRIAWLRPGRDAVRDVVAEVRTPLGTELRSLARELVVEGERTVPALVGELVVPYGDTVVTGFVPGGDAPAWTRTVMVSRPNAELTVEPQR